MKDTVSPDHHLNRGQVSMRQPSERGSGTVLMMGVMTLTAMTAFVAACLMSWIRCVHQTRSVADLAALAGAEALNAGRDACDTAAVTATSNRTTMTACVIESNGIDFVVRVTVQMDAKPQVPFGPTQFVHTSEAGHVT